MDSSTTQNVLPENYLGLLKKFKSDKNHVTASSSVHQLSKKSVSGFTSGKIPIQEPNSKYQYNKFNQSFIKNQRTVLYNNLSQSKFKYKLIKHKPAIGNFSCNENIRQRTVLNKHPLSQCKKPDLSSDTSSKEASKVPPTSSMKETSKSFSLLKEIESLTNMLKKTSAIKSKTINSSVKSSNMINKPRNSKASNSNFKYCADSKLNDTKHKSMFSKINDPFKRELKFNSNINTPVVFGKSSCNININLVPDKKRESLSVHSNSLKPNKYCYKKVNTENPLSSKTVCFPLKTLDDEKNLNSNIQKSLSQPHLQKATSQNSKLVAADNSCGGIKIEVTSLNQNSNLKLNVTANRVMSRTKVNNLHQNTIRKSQNLLRTSDVAKICGTNSKYKRVNANHSVLLNKNLRLKTASHLRSPFTKRTKRQINTKFKVINKTVTPRVNRKVVLNKSTFGCKENSPIVVDKSDPLFKYLNDSTVDKLEKDLLAISTTLTSSPTSGKNCCKGLRNKSKKMDTKLSHKQMSLKKPKARISKYKVVNSGASKSSALVKSSNFTNLKNVKKTKFSVINKRTLPVHVTPVKQEKSVLIKRLFKSKNAIVNKNVNSSYYSAKMIKCKYFSLNKRKLPFEKPALYSKTSFLKPHLKGYLSTKVYCKKGRPQKGQIGTYSQRTTRNVSRYGYNRHTTPFNRSYSSNNSKRKFHCGYRQSPVVFIRGLKYACNSSGKTLRKLPTQDFSKLHQKFTFNGKRYVKIHENKMKALAPTSANLASRVLHRSITRVLSASSKKKLIKVNSYCMFYNRFGRCNRGVKCTYIHDPSKIAVCTRFLRGTCKVDGCPFSHEITPGKMAICSFFLVGACDNDNCPYRHESLSPNAELCKAFVQGYCPRGKECQKAHILICPKYIQGNCEKGASCAFPHPPQKARKNVQKETNEESEQEALFEKVARYFQPNENTSITREEKSEDNSAVKTFVPKHRRLEEQPSFIPLSDSTFE